MKFRPIFSMACAGMLLASSGVVHAADLGDPLEKICFPREPGADKFSASLIYGGPASKPLQALSDGVVLFADWITGESGCYRALVLMVEYDIQNKPGCLVGYRGIMHNYRHAASRFKAGDTLGEWGEKQ